MQLLEDDLSGPEIARFLRQHLEEMHRITPLGSVHALALEDLRRPEITFWSAWEGDELVGCGALKELDSRSGEIKSMRTAETRRGRGIGSRILDHIVREAERRGYRFLVLETGALPAFAAARSFYERHGFEPCGPFADYRDDPNSVFMTRSLE